MRVFKYIGILFILEGFAYPQSNSADKKLPEAIDYPIPFRKTQPPVGIREAVDKAGVRQPASTIAEAKEYMVTAPPRTQAYRRGLQMQAQLILASFRNNIRFGGFWEQYAIINFSPSVFVSPFDFISVYGNHTTSYYIPRLEIKNSVKPLILEGAAVLAVDNGIRFLLGTEGLVPAVVNFALKNIVFGFLKNNLKDNWGKETNWYNSYFYSVSVRF
jgi:hypothetical protein